MSIFGAFNNYIDKLLGLEKPFTPEEREIIGMEVSNALLAVRVLADHYATIAIHEGATMEQHVDRIGLGLSFHGDITHFELAQCVDPRMTVPKFIRGVSEAFHLWPYLVTRFNRPSRSVFSHAVKVELFENNESGWEKYVESMRRRGLEWFGQEDSR